MDAGQPLDPAGAPVDDPQPVDGTTMPDPEFCPDGTTPAGGPGTCGAQQATIAAAISDATTAGTAGTIYLEEGATFTETINLSGQSTALTFSGGWDFVSNIQGTTTTLNAPINITSSSGAITFSNIVFGSSALFRINGSNNVFINGTSNNDTVQVTLAGTTASTVTVNGNGGGDGVTVNFSGNSGNKTVHVNDGGGSGTDTLTVNGTSGNDGFQITNSSITLGNETVDFSGIETTALKVGLVLTHSLVPIVLLHII